MQVLMISKRIFLIMIAIIKKRVNVNHASFDDAKVESNKVVSTNIQRLCIASRLI